VREAATSLKRARALLVLVEERGTSLAAVLRAVGTAARAIIVVVDASDEATPSFVHDLASDHVLEVRNALALDGATQTQTQTHPRAHTQGRAHTHALTLPSFAMRSSALPHDLIDALIDDALFPLAQSIVRARAFGVLSGDAKVGLKTVRAGDVSRLSLCCIELLGRLGPQKATRR
jgi:hypothetical protein